jgi:hypothetical protein
LERKRILQEKAVQNNERKSNLVILANQLLSRSEVFINGTPQEISSTSEGKTKVIKAFQILIKSVYANLRMLGNQQYTEDTIRRIILSTQDDLFGTDDATISEAENEILIVLERRKRQSDRTSLNDLKNHFSIKPFGWYQSATWSMVARLYKRGKIEIKKDSNLLEDHQVIDALLISSNYGNTLVEVQRDIDPTLIRELKSLYSEAFDETCPHQEAKDIAIGFKDKLSILYQDINGLILNSNNYPFLNLLLPIQEQMIYWAGKDYSYFLLNRPEYEDTLLDAKEDLIDPIKKFMNGDQRKIYDDIRLLVNSDTTNLSFVDGDEMDELRSVISHEKPFVGNLIREAKATMDSLKTKILEKIKNEKELAVERVNNIISHFKEKDEFSQLNDGQKEEVLKPFNSALREIKEERYISNIRNIALKVQDSIEAKQLTELLKLTSKGQEKDDVLYIKANNIIISYEKRELKTDEDVDEYIETLREKYKDQISKRRRIIL